MILIYPVFIWFYKFQIWQIILFKYKNIIRKAFTTTFVIINMYIIIGIFYIIRFNKVIISSDMIIPIYIKGNYNKIIIQLQFFKRFE